MKRGRRIISRGLDVVCVFTLIVLLFFYVRQIWKTDLVSCQKMEIELGVWSERGLITIYGISDRADWGLHDGWGFDTWENESSDFNWWFVVGKYHRKVAPGTPAYQVGFPTWFLILMFAIKPACSLFGWHRMRKRIAAGMCASCGYDLRNIKGNSCPECGAGFSTRV